MDDLTWIDLFGVHSGMLRNKMQLLIRSNHMDSSRYDYWKAHTYDIARHMVSVGMVDPAPEDRELAREWLVMVWETWFRTRTE